MRVEMKQRIRGLVHQRKLFYLPLLVPGDETVRSMFVSQEVNSDVYPPWPDNWDGLRLAAFRETLDAFTRYERIGIADRPLGKSAAAYMARVEPVVDEIFDIRSIDPRPGIRALGAFAGKDAFIALTWDYRENLTDSYAWDAFIEHCKSMWDDLFGSIKQFKGSTLDDYLSNFHAV